MTYPTWLFIKISKIKSLRISRVILDNIFWIKLQDNFFTWLICVDNSTPWASNLDNSFCVKLTPPRKRALPYYLSVLSSLFSNCMQFDIMFQHLSLANGPKNPTTTSPNLNKPTQYQNLDKSYIGALVSPLEPSLYHNSSLIFLAGK